MAVFQLYFEQSIPAEKETVWQFIATPRNLKRITPDYMGFEVTSRHVPDQMYPGLIISYKVSPLFGIKTTWVTEITHIVDNDFFVDEQRAGPYKIWHHEHRLKSINGGVLMTDLITYQPPFGILGSIANSLFIEKKIKDIFAYRKRVLEEIFGEFH